MVKRIQCYKCEIVPFASVPLRCPLSLLHTFLSLLLCLAVSVSFSVSFSDSFLHAWLCHFLYLFPCLIFCLYVHLWSPHSFSIFICMSLTLFLYSSLCLCSLSISISGFLLSLSIFEVEKCIERCTDRTYHLLRVRHTTRLSYWPKSFIADESQNSA